MSDPDTTLAARSRLVTTWLSRYTNGAVAEADHRDEPEARLRELAYDTRHAYALVARRCERLSTWYLALYQRSFLIDKAPRIALLAMASRYLSAYIDMRAALARLGRPAAVPLWEAALAMCLPAILNWQPQCMTIGQLILDELDSRMLDTKPHGPHAPGRFYRHFWYCVRLYASWRRIPIDLRRYAQPKDMAPYDDALAIWRTCDVALLTRHLDAMADHHHAMAREASNHEVFEFDNEDRMLFPYEILLLLRLREWEGLPNPNEFHHPLLRQRLAAMPLFPVTRPSMPLLDTVIGKFKTAYPGSFLGKTEPRRYMPSANPNTHQGTASHADRYNDHAP